MGTAYALFGSLGILPRPQERPDVAVPDHRQRCQPDDCAPLIRRKLRSSGSAEAPRLATHGTVRYRRSLAHSLTQKSPAARARPRPPLVGGGAEVRYLV